MDTLCVLPFIHFNVLANGQASVCCVSNDVLPGEDGKPLNVRTHSLDAIWNSQALRDVRAQMLAGKAPRQCACCYRAEKLYGFGSHRTGQNSLFLTDKADGVTEWRRFPKIGRDELKVEMGKPWYFDLRFDNLCNLQCVICFGYASSRIENDPVHSAWTGEAAIERVPNRFGNARRWVRSQVLIDELKEIGSEVRYIQLAGGEPFLSELALKWLAHLGETGRAREVTLKVFTNLTTLNDKIIGLLEPFRFIDMTLSIDGAGPVYEYVRYPGKWEAVERNAEILAGEQTGRLPQMTVNINATMSAHGAYSILDLFEFAKRHDFGVTLSNAMDPAYVSTKYLPNRTKADLERRLRAYAAANPRFELMKGHIDQWMPELKSVDITSPLYRERVLDLMRFTNDMDASRGTTFRAIQPQVYDDFVAEFGGWIQENRHAGAGTAKGFVADGELTFGDKVYPIVSRIGGSVEGADELPGEFTIRGWAADHLANKSAVRVVAAIGTDVVTSIAPTMERPDIEGGIGSGIRPAGFSINVEKIGNRPTLGEPIRLFALTVDNCAVPIASSPMVGAPLAEVPFTA
jgi:MoaA/NifB/PqqE/SkfB family radical SAM enzyme